MKKFLLFILTIILCTIKVEAKSINDLYKELESLEAQKELYTYLNSNDIKALLSTSSDIELAVEALNEEINTINNDILIREDKIKTTEEEIDNIFIFNQISEGENTYLEYIFDTDNYSEFIYRYMVVEQLTEYNNSIIEKLNKEIKSLNEKKDALNKKIEKLSKSRENFRELELVLKSTSNGSFQSISTSLEEDITSLKRQISEYETLGCNRYMDLSLCLNIKDNNSLMYPLIKGCVTKDYIVGSSSHKGIDLGCNKEGSYIYSAGYGVVADIIYKSSCGGNIIFIYHKVNGKEYTSIYAHLLEVKVDIGDPVTSDTIIGTVGGETTAVLNGGYDRCTNGAHLHYALVEGYHTNDFNIYTLNPRYMHNYPNVLDGYFTR